MSTKPSTGLNLNFDNRFVSKLPADIETENYRRQVYESCYSFVEPKKVIAPELVAYSKEMAEELGLSEADCQTDEFAQVFVGNKLLEEMQPFA
jgi:uncharacterized protein YdiU (UPF0061 family)